MNTAIQEEENQAVNPLIMSDEEFLKQGATGVSSESAPALEEVDTPVEEVEEESTEEEISEEESESNPGEKSAPATETTTEVKPEVKTEANEKTTEETPTETKTEPATPDYKAIYEKVFAPFNANGKQIKVETPEEAITLMQMGANYNKKMAALKPNLKLLKMLENNSLLDENKLSFLIDLDKKSPEAIKRLVTESGIALYDLEAVDDATYKPQNYTVDEKALALDAVLESIQETPTYAKTVDVISNRWDAASRKIIVESPNIISMINDHMQNGIFDRVNAELERERMLGRYMNMSDIDAYSAVGDKLFGQANTPEVKPTAPTPSPAIVAAPIKAKTDPTVVDKKRAAAPVKAATRSVTPADFNPLDLPDEEFKKIMPKFI